MLKRTLILLTIGLLVVGAASAQDNTTTFESAYSGLNFALPEGWQVVDGNSLLFVANSEEAMDAIPIRSGHLLIALYNESFIEWAGYFNEGEPAGALDILDHYAKHYPGVMTGVEIVEPAHTLDDFELDAAAVEITNDTYDGMILVIRPDEETVIHLQVQAIAGEMDDFREDVYALAASIRLEKFIPPTPTPLPVTQFTTGDGWIAFEFLDTETVLELDNDTIRVGNFEDLDNVENMENFDYYHEIKTVALADIGLAEDDDRFLSRLVEAVYPGTNLFDLVPKDDESNFPRTFLMASDSAGPVFIEVILPGEGRAVLVSTHWLQAYDNPDQWNFVERVMIDGQPVVIAE